MIGAVRQPPRRSPATPRRRRSSRPAGQGGVPRIARAAEHLVEGAAGAELRRVRLAITMPPLRSMRSTTGCDLSARDWRTGASRRRSARRRRQSGSLIDTGRPASHPASSATSRPWPAMRRFAVAGAVEAESWQGVHRRLDLGDARRRGLDQIERRILCSSGATPPRPPSAATTRYSCRSPSFWLVSRLFPKTANSPARRSGRRRRASGSQAVRNSFVIKGSRRPFLQVLPSNSRQLWFRCLDHSACTPQVP